MAVPAYFNQYPDVAASYAQNNYGLTQEQYAQAHYQNYGVNEQRISPAAAAAQTAIRPTITPVAAAYFQQNPDVAEAYQENTYGLTPDQFAATHYQLYGQEEQRAAPVAAAVNTVNTANLANTANTTTALPAYFTQNPDVAASYKINNYGLTAQQFADAHYAKFGQFEQRISPTSAPAIIPIKPVTPVVKPPVTPVVKPPVTPVTPVVNRTTTGAALPYFQLNPDVAASYLTNSYGLTPEQFAAAHYSQYGQFEQRTAPTTSPFANATSGFGQNFQNYQSIPIGAQYNPNVVGGTGSPYSQIMGQMRPAGPYNPYMGVASNTPMGGYDPGLYDRIAQANAVANLAAGTETVGDSGGAGGGGGDGGGGDGGGGDGGGGGGGGGGAMAKGGMVHGGLMFGANPPGPDDGAVNLDVGEYVIKKSAVNKYGRGLLDMINEGKVPAKKIRSLLD